MKESERKLEYSESTKKLLTKTGLSVEELVEQNTMKENFRLLKEVILCTDKDAIDSINEIYKITLASSQSISLIMGR